MCVKKFLHKHVFNHATLIMKIGLAIFIVVNWKFQSASLSGEASKLHYKNPTGKANKHTDKKVSV